MKKIAAFLAIIMALVSFSTYVASADVRTQNDMPVSQEAQELFTSLGIDLPQLSENEAQVSRGDFLYTLMQILGFQSNGSKNYSFTDINSDKLSGVLEYAISMGIISDGASFEPDRPVTYNEAYKMGVAAIGKNIEAIAKGGYPSGYVSVANSSGFNQELTFSETGTLTVNDFYCMLYNIATAEIMEQTQSGDTDKYNTVKDRTILTQRQNLVKIDGIVEANEYTSLYTDATTCGESHITIGGKDYQYFGEYTLGTRVQGYAKKDSKTNELVYIRPYENNILTLDSEDISLVNAGKISYTDEKDATKNISLASGIATVYNGKSTGKYDITTITDIDGQITLIDNDRDRVYDVISIREGYTISVQSVDAVNRIIYDMNSTNSLNMSASDASLIVKNAVGQTELASVKKGNIITCYVSADKKYAEAVVSSAKLSGTVTETMEDEDKLYIGENIYSYTAYFKAYYFPNVQIGNEYTFLLDENGKLAALTERITTMEYGYLLKLAKQDGLNDDYMAKMVLTSGKIKIFNFADKVIFNGNRVDKKDVANALGLKSATTEQLVRYKLDASENIGVLDTEDTATGAISDTDDDENNLKRYSFFGYDSSSTVRYKNIGVFGTYFAINSATIVFDISTRDESDDKRCSVVGKSFFVNDRFYTCKDIKAYNVSEAGLAEVLVYIDSEDASNISDEATCGVVDSVRKAVDADGMDAYKISIYNAQTDKFGTYYLKDETLWENIEKSSGESYPIACGDFIRIEADRAGEITSLSKDFRCSDRTILNAGSISGLRYYVYGNVYAIDGDFCMLISGTKPIDPEKITDDSKMVAYIKNNVAIYDTKNKTLSSGTLNDLVPYLSDTENYSKILIKMRYTECTDIIIYK